MVPVGGDVEVGKCPFSDPNPFPSTIRSEGPDGVKSFRVGYGGQRCTVGVGLEGR